MYSFYITQLSNSNYRKFGLLFLTATAPSGIFLNITLALVGQCFFVGFMAVVMTAATTTAALSHHKVNKSSDNYPQKISK
jgi:hypothetical protein